MKTPVSTQPIKIALIDLYDGEPNQGVRAINELLTQYSQETKYVSFSVDRYETRLNGEAPDLSYDIYISTGGPGSPFDGKDKPWESTYFTLVEQLWNYNEKLTSNSSSSSPKYVFFICHSFQMMCRFFELGDVVQRESESFGIFKTFITEKGTRDILFDSLTNPFYAADFRKWQVINPNHVSLDALDAEIISIERPRSQDTLERALMGIRINKQMAGVQFHPEADPPGMLIHFQMAKRKQQILKEYGSDSYEQLINRLRFPQYLPHTYKTVIPNFLKEAIISLRHPGF